MSKILCIIDGMTDPQFRAGEYPNLSAMHLAGYMDTCRGNEPESLGCILRLLGVAQVPDKLRGYAEALGEGILVDENDLVLRGSWFALDNNGVCTVPVPGPVSLPLSDCYRYYHLDQYKSLLVFPGMAASVDAIKTYPPYVCSGKKAALLCPEGNEVLREAFLEWLNRDRCVIPWGQSVPSNLPPFPGKAAVICGTTIVKGIAKLLDMDLILVPGATGDVDTDLEAKVIAAVIAAEKYPFVLLHINGADEAAHRKNPVEKKTFLKHIDALVLSQLLRSNHEITVVADHGTDPATGLHLGTKQPVFFSS